MTTELIVALIGLAGVIIGAIPTYFYMRQQIEKMKAETKKLEAETQAISVNIKNLSATVSYKLDDTTEQVIYDGTTMLDFHAFRGVEGQFWRAKENAHTGPTGHGSLKLEQSKDGIVLNIRRTNTEGRFETWLEHYIYSKKKYEFIPRNDLIAGSRKIRVRCEAKTIDGEHTLVFILRDKATNVWLASTKEMVKGNEWSPIDLFFSIKPTSDVQFRIDDQELSNAPSSAQIRKLIITEKISD